MLGRLPLLEELNASGNRISELSADTLAQKLCRVDLSDNLLTALPDVFSAMPHLVELIVDHNRLVSLPASLANSTTLRFVSVRSNPIANASEQMIGRSGRPAAILELLREHTQGGPQPGISYFENPAFFFDIVLAINGIANVLSLLRIYFNRKREAGSVELVYGSGTRVQLSGLTRQKANCNRKRT